MGKATEKQLSYAYAIADELGLNRPLDDFKECQIFISTHKEEYDRAIRVTSIGCYDFKRLADCIGKYTFEWMIDNLFHKAGIYCFAHDKQILYIGKSINLADRIAESYYERSRYGDINRILYYITPTKSDAHILEIVLIAENKPPLNSDCKTDDYPKLFQSNIDIFRDFKEIKIKK